MVLWTHGMISYKMNSLNLIIILTPLSHPSAMRPRNIDYQQFIHLVEIYRESGWDPIKQSSSADVQTTGIFWQERLPI